MLFDTIQITMYELLLNEYISHTIIDILYIGICSRNDHQWDVCSTNRYSAIMKCAVMVKELVAVANMLF